MATLEREREIEREREREREKGEIEKVRERTFKKVSSVKTSHLS